MPRFLLSLQISGIGWEIVEIVGNLFGVVGIEVGWSECHDRW